MAKKITDGTFEAEVINADKPVLLDFYADWCGPCKMMGPIVEELAAAYDGKAIVGKLNVDDNMEASGRYNVMTIPTFILFKDGEAKEIVNGVQTRAMLNNMIEKYL